MQKFYNQKDLSLLIWPTSQIGWLTNPEIEFMAPAKLEVNPQDEIVVGKAPGGLYHVIYIIEKINEVKQSKVKKRKKIITATVQRRLR